ncbi:MAG: response regulator [Vallitalea sp.]|jgi:two-component system response regulator YesN|nr:response regulator [Vallitalea sp.]
MSHIYNLIVVDDEFFIRDGLLSYHWDQFGFNIIGSASNGKEALQLIENNTIDLVITDIRMPVMDGLALCKIIQEKYPRCKTLLLTGYKDFDYAQEAIRAGVSDYILKPVNMRKLDEILQALKEDLDKMNDNLSIIEAYKKQLTISLPLARENFIQALIEGVILEQDELNDILELLELPFSNQYYASFIIKINCSDFSYITQNKEIIEQKIYHSPNVFVFDIIKYENSYCHIICVINFQRPYSGVSTHSFLHHYLNTIYFELFGLLKENVTSINIGIGNIYKNLQSIEKSYKEALHCLEQTLFYPSEHILYIWHNSMKLYIETMEYPYDCEERLMYSLFEKSIKDVYINLDDFVEKAIKFANKNSTKAFHHAISQLLHMLIRKLTKFGITEDKVITLIKQSMDTLQNQQHIEDIKNLLKNIFLQSYNSIQNIINKDIHVDNVIINKAIDYIKKNYNNKITLKDISDSVYLTPSYFSLQFKKYTGMNYIEYLTNYRLKKAQELLKNSDLKVYEIGHMIGYDDSKYFTENFKKHFSQTPTQYRNQLLHES